MLNTVLIACAPTSLSMTPRDMETERRCHPAGIGKEGLGCSQSPDPAAAETPPALLPHADVIRRVFSQLDCVDLLSCSLVCRQWYRDSAELRDGWKAEYMEASAFFSSGIKRDVHPPSSTCSIRGLHSWCP